MHQVKRISTAPATPLRIMIDQADGGGDGGFGSGGTFYFSPAGEDGDSHQMATHAAKAIMGDPGLAPHFECTPPVTPVVAQDVTTDKPAAKQKADTKKKADGE